MTRRLYFTCHIQALYMAKEFGVRFSNITKGNEEVCIAQKIIDQDRMNGVMDKRYWVAPESEGIFEPKLISIIMRDNKQFFMPEVENDR